MPRPDCAPSQPTRPPPRESARPGAPARRTTTRRLPALVALAALLGACELAPAPAATGLAPPAAAARSEPPGTCGQPDLPAQALAKINAYRAAGARCGSAGSFGRAAPLTWQASLAAAAAAHGRELAAQGGLSHTSADGRQLTQRLEGVGYAWREAAESLAAGQASLALALADWVASPGHCANLMSPKVTEAGLACQRATDGTAYWALVLARPR